MAIDCLAIKNVFDARIASHLYDSVYAELEKLSSISGMENLGDVVFALLASTEKDQKDGLMLASDSIALSIISIFGFHPPEGEPDFFPPISLMSIGSPILHIGGGFWKPLSENYKIKI